MTKPMENYITTVVMCLMASIIVCAVVGIGKLAAIGMLGITLVIASIFYVIARI